MCSGVERAFKFSKLQPGQKDVLRKKINDVLISNKKTHKNVTDLEARYLEDLKTNPDIIVCKADKGGTTVILSTTQYNIGLDSILNTPTYKKPEKRVSVNSIHTALKVLIKASPYINEAKKRALIPSHVQPGRMYILPKIHKPALTFRPIISCIGTPTYALSKFLVDKLAHLSKLNIHSIKDSYEFVKKLQELPTDNVTMVSFDVTAMFTNVPIKGSLKSLERHLVETNTEPNDISAILNLVQFCLNNTIFTANQKTYCQKNGLPMGGPLSPLMCDIYLHYLETQILEETPIELKAWIRYVDDIFSLINGNISSIETVLTYINTLDADIQFTAEVETNGSLPFLDVLITRTQSKFETTVYRKPYSVQVPPHFKSTHAYSQKVTAFYTYVKRAIEFCNNPSALTDELSFLKWVAYDRGFSPTLIDEAFRKFSTEKPVTYLSPLVKLERPMAIIPYFRSVSSKVANVLRPYFRVIFQPVNKLSNKFHPPKDCPPADEKWGIYFIPCSCEFGYIGQTRRPLKKRLNEHRNMVRNADLSKSNIAKHSWENDHEFKFKEAKIIISTKSPVNLDFLEAFAITKYKNKLVNDEHFPFISNLWKDVIVKTGLKLE